MDTGAVKEERFTPEAVMTALQLTQGNVSLAARNLNTSRSTLYNYLIRYPELKQALTDAREGMIDHAESALRQAAIKGEAWAVCFMLKTIGRGRGYVERQEINITSEDESARQAFAHFRAQHPDLTEEECRDLLSSGPNPIPVELMSDKVQ